MNSLTIILTHSPHPLQFHFDKYSDAVKHTQDLGTGEVSIRIHDDYNCQADIRLSEIAAIVVTDVEQEMKAHEDVAIEKIRSDMRTNKRANAEASSGLQIPGQHRNFINN